MLLTRQQREAVRALYVRASNKANTEPFDGSYADFRRTVSMGFGCIMVPWAGMWFGIESDGYTHT